MTARCRLHYFNEVGVNKDCERDGVTGEFREVNNELHIQEIVL
jgi:hypothetical protein